MHPVVVNYHTNRMSKTGNRAFCERKILRDTIAQLFACESPSNLQTVSAYSSFFNARKSVGLSNPQCNRKATFLDNDRSNSGVTRNIAASVACDVE